MHLATQSRLFLKQRPARVEIQSERRFETERASASHHGVSAVKQRDRSQHDSAIGKTLDVNDRGKIVRAIEFQFQAGGERLFNQRNGLRFGRINVFHQQFRALDRARQCDHSGCEQIARAQLARFHNDVTADDIGNQPTQLLKIANVISRQLRIRFGQFGRTHRVIPIVELFSAQKFSRRRPGCSTSNKSRA